MRRHFVSLLCILLIFAGLSGSNGDVSSLEVSKSSLKSLIGNDFNGPARRSLLSHPNEHETALVAALDGSIYLMDLQSRKILWTFTSGPSIYSSYHAPLNHDSDKENASGPVCSYFIDCGDDWNLYIHNKLGKVKLQTSIEEYLRITPHITEDGHVLLGSRETTVFIVNAKTGRLINSFKSDSPNLKTDELPLYITRTDYTLKHLDRDKTVLWNVTVADIGAAFLCQDVENSFGLSDSGYELPSEPDTNFNMPLPCQSKAVVYRFRNHNMLEAFYRHNMLPEARHEDTMLTVSTSNNMLPSQPKVDKLLEFDHKDKIPSEQYPNLLLPSQPNVDMDSHHESDIDSVVSLPSLTGNLGISGFQDVKVPLNDNPGVLSQGSIAYTFIPLVTILVGFTILLYVRKQVEFPKDPSNMNARFVQSKRKKIRKSGKNNGSGEKKDKLENEYAHTERDKLLLNLNQLTDGSTTGRTVGKLFVSNTEIAKGSNGTIVLEGVYGGRLVAVKRLVKAHHDFALKEIQNLIASDQHSNIVRWYGVEYDHDFVYLALERCSCSLYDLIQMSLDSIECPLYCEDQAKKAMTEYKARLDSTKGIMLDVKLWKPNGHPSPILLKLMRDVVSGLVHLHELGIIHRDLKPQNVLIIKEKSLCAKLSDMGISKRLIEDMSSLGHHATGNGSSGWQAPEQLLHGRQTRAVDIFSLGCVLFFCITGGRHPFGDHLERDINITKNEVDLFLVENIPEALDLFFHLLDPDPELRPKALEVFHHPLFWNCEMRLSFFRDASDRVELEDRETDSDLLKALESIAPIALGGKWDEKMEPAFLNNIGRYRRYKFDSVRDILRVMRNKLNHYRELPLEIQEIVGPVPEGFDGYFASRFPKLLIEVYKVIHKFCREEECFQKYF